MAPRGRKWKQSEIIDAFKQTHGNTYDYSRVVYTDVDTNVWIGCKKHPKSPLADENGIVWFQQTPHHHIAGEGCPMCNESHGERTIAQLLTTADITYERHKEFEWLPKRCHVDIYLPDYNVAIEYQGELHYLPKFGQAELVKQQQRDSIKKRLCKQNNLPLYEITYKDDIEQKLKEILDSVSGNTVQQTINNTTNESKTNKNMKKNIVKINEAQLRNMVAKNIKVAICEWTDPDSDKFYPGKSIYYPQDGKIAGDMSYDINDIAGLAEDTPDSIVNGIKEYFEYDYVNWEDERDSNAPVILYVMSSNGSVIGNTYYISSLDAEYAGEIQAKLGAGAKVISVNPANNISESKTNKNMKKNVIKLNEDTLRQIVAESVKKVLNEQNPLLKNGYEVLNLVQAYQDDDSEEYIAMLQNMSEACKKQVEEITGTSVDEMLSHWYAFHQAMIAIKKRYSEFLTTDNNDGGYYDWR